MSLRTIEKFKKKILKIKYKINKLNEITWSIVQLQIKIIIIKIIRKIIADIIGYRLVIAYFLPVAFVRYFERENAVVSVRKNIIIVKKNRNQEKIWEILFINRQSRKWYPANCWIFDIIELWSMQSSIFAQRLLFC